MMSVALATDIFEDEFRGADAKNGTRTTRNMLDRCRQELVRRAAARRPQPRTISSIISGRAASAARLVARQPACRACRQSKQATVRARLGSPGQELGEKGVLKSGTTS